VLSAISDKEENSEFSYVRALSEATNTKIPSPIAELENAEVRFKNVCDKTEMTQVIKKALKID